MQISVKQRMAWPLVGAITVVAGWAPVSQATPSAGTRDASQKAPAADPGDGTYESCAAYFGFGKESDALEVVSFDVSDENGDDGVVHAVSTDTQVIFQMTNEDGDTLECEAPEITEADWQAAMDSIYLPVPEDRPLPTYPGPGHYAYPTVTESPYIANDDIDFGTVTAVAFEVVSIPAGHTLVSPTGLTPLVQHYPLGFTDSSSIPDPRVLAFIEANAGAAARQAFESALTDCPDGDFGPDLRAAIDALEDYRGYSYYGDQPDCGWVEALNGSTSMLLGLDATRAYVEPIVLALPTATSTTSTTPSSTSTTIATESTVVTAPVPTAPGSQAVGATPTYTG